MVAEGYIFIIAILIQWVAFVPAYLLSSEKFFDLIGSFTFLTVIIFSLYVSTSLNFTKILISLLVMTWACRLGIFLFFRVNSNNGDSRFDNLKKSAVSFFGVWSLQGIWVFITASTAIFAITSPLEYEFDLLSFIGLSLWVVGIVIEVVADKQKSNFRKDPKNKNLFIQTGLWSVCRHPNYTGEIILWVGIAFLAYPYLTGLKLFSLISPIFVYLLLTKISGIPLLERAAEFKWGNDENFISYKKRTGKLFPKLF
tara:strand:+ start:788 stop:1552 length:765 start_codon:yes stop_codon:yes gene_type:complete